MAVYSNQTRSWQDSTSDAHIISHMEDCSALHSSLHQSFQYQANLDVRFYVGDTDVWRDVYGSELPLTRQNFNFPLLKRLVEMPSGYQRQNRKSITSIPIEGSDQKTADQFTKLLMYIAQKEQSDETISSGFLSSLITGICFAELYLDYSHDPLSGDLKMGLKPYNSVMFDPFFKRNDFSDSGYFWTREMIAPKQLNLLLPAYKDKLNDLGLLEGRSGAGISDNKFQYMPESIFYGQNKKLVTYDSFSYLDNRPATFLYEERTGKKIEWTGEDKDLRQYVQAFPDIKVAKEQVATVKQAIVVNGHVIYNGGNILGIDEYNVTPILSYYTPESNSLDYRLQGMIRPVRDAQYLFNQTTISMLDNIASQPNAGWIAKEGTVVNPTELVKPGPGKTIWTKKHATPEDLVKIQPGSLPSGLFELSTQMKSLPNDILGVTEELLGSAEDDIPGIRSMLKQGAALITLRRLFDQLDSAMKIIGKKQVKILQRNYTPGKVERILNEQPSQEFYDRDFGTYDIAIEEGFNTTTQKQLEMAQLMQLKELIPELPAQALIQAATIQNKDEIIQMMQEEAQAKAQASEQEAQVAQQETDATLKMADAQANYQNAGARKRDSDVEQNLAQAEKDEEQALLNKAKALKELEDIDITAIEKLIALARSIQPGNNEKQLNP